MGNPSKKRVASFPYVSLPFLENDHMIFFHKSLFFSWTGK